MNRFCENISQMLGRNCDVLSMCAHENVWESTDKIPHSTSRKRDTEFNSSKDYKS